MQGPNVKKFRLAPNRSRQMSGPPHYPGRDQNSPVTIYSAEKATNKLNLRQIITPIITWKFTINKTLGLQRKSFLPFSGKKIEARHICCAYVSELVRQI